MIMFYIILLIFPFENKSLYSSGIYFVYLETGQKSEEVVLVEGMLHRHLSSLWSKTMLYTLLSVFLNIVLCMVSKISKSSHQCKLT